MGGEGRVLWKIFIDSDFGAESFPPIISKGGGSVVWKNLIDSIFEAESIPTIIPRGGGFPTIENFVDSVCGAESNAPILGGGAGPMVLDHRSPGLTSANDLHDLFIANYDSPRRASGKTIILHNYGEDIH